MSEYDRDRGAYSPTGEAPLAFDPREPGGRGAGRPPTTLIISALILLVLIVGLIFFYRSGVRRNGEPPVVGQPLSNIRQPAPASAQPADEAAGLQIYGADKAPSASAAPGFAPLPEEPLPRPVASAPPPSVGAGPVLSTPVQPQAPASAPAAAPALRPTPAPPVAVQTPAVAAPTATAGGAMVQIGAFSSTALADKGWGDVARLLPGQMAGKTKKVEPVPDSALYRAFVGGFASKADAAAFCSDLKAAGHACFVK